jgi:transposase-like protein
VTIAKSQLPKCPHCRNDDQSMIELILHDNGIKMYLCSVCSKTFIIEKENE